MKRALHHDAANPRQARSAAIALALALPLACAHVAASAPSTTPAPKPDPAAVQEALETDACRPGEPSRACPANSFTPQPYVSARAYAHLLAALLAAQSEDYPASASELREALLYDPESPYLHTALADAQIHLGRVGDAEEELKAALRFEPQYGPAHVLAGRIEGARGHVAEARSHLRVAIEAEPESPDAYRELVHLETSVPDAQAASAAAVALEQVARAVNTRSQAAERAEQFAEEHPGSVEPDPEGSLLASAARLRDEAGRAWSEVARSFADKRDDSDAELAFARAEAIDPAGLEQIAARASFLETRRRFPEAREEELKLLARRPEAPEVLASLSRLALEAGDAESAEAHLRKLIDLAAEVDAPPAAGPAGHDGGGASPDAGAASSELAERTDERREMAGSLLRAGLPLLGARRPAAASPAFDAALRLMPEQPELLFYRALALGGRGRAKEAATLLAQVAAMVDAHPGPTLLGAEPAALALDARVQSALALGRAGEQETSLRELRALFAANPLDEGAALGLLEGYDRAGHAADSVPLFAAALESHPGDPSLLFTLGSAQDRAGQQDAAVETMRRLLARAPDHAGALNYVGYSLVEKGGAAALADAHRMLERAVELRPDDGAIADSYGLCLLKLGHAREALVELRRADALTPGDPVVLGHLGDALLAEGDRAAAASAFRRALERLKAPPAHAPSRGRASARADEALEERAPEPNDARVKAELLEKLRALTAP